MGIADVIHYFAWCLVVLAPSISGDSARIVATTNLAVIAPTAERGVIVKRSLPLLHVALVEQLIRLIDCGPLGTSILYRPFALLKFSGVAQAMWTSEWLGDDDTELRMKLALPSSLLCNRRRRSVPVCDVSQFRAISCMPILLCRVKMRVCFAFECVFVCVLVCYV